MPCDMSESDRRLAEVVRNLWEKKSLKIRFDAQFHAFQEISKVVGLLIPKGYQLTGE